MLLLLLLLLLLLVVVAAVTASELPFFDDTVVTLVTVGGGVLVLVLVPMMQRMAMTRWMTMRVGIMTRMLKTKTTTSRKKVPSIRNAYSNMVSFFLLFPPLLLSEST